MRKEDFDIAIEGIRKCQMGNKDWRNSSFKSEIDM